MTDARTGAPAPPVPWGITATFGWSLIALLIGWVAAAVGYGVWLERDPTAATMAPYDARPLAVTLIIANAAAISVLVWAVQRRGWLASDYFALTPFRRRDLEIGVLLCVVVGLALAFVGWVAGFDWVTPFQIQVYRSTPGNLWFVVVHLAVIVVAPAGEEIVFRGFMFRGWVRPGRSPVAAIVIISLLWALAHVQYDWWGALQIFVLGLLFGMIRWSSGSTLLTFVLHALVNLEASIETFFKVEWL